MKLYRVWYLLGVCSLLLLSCSAPTPSPVVSTPVPTSAATTLATPTPRPSPSATPRATPTPFAPPTTAPTARPTLMPTPVRVPLQPQTRIGAFFFYWYDCPRHDCDPATVAALPPGWTDPLPHDHDPRDGTRYSSRNEDWYEGEFRAMRDAGIDILFPVSWGDHPHEWFRQQTLNLLVQANESQPTPLPIGMFLDTTAEQAMYNRAQGKGYRYDAGALQLPLSDPASGWYFYNLHVRGFYERIPRALWATVRGRPVIIVYGAGCCVDLQYAGSLWAAVKDAFVRDFGVRPWLILEDTWFAAPALAPPVGRPSILDVADGRYRWGAALYGPQQRTFKEYTVTSVGPGFDNRRIAPPAAAQHRSRAATLAGANARAGTFFRESLATVSSETDLLLIETWNEWPEATGIAVARYPAAEGGAVTDDAYLRMLRLWRYGR